VQRFWLFLHIAGGFAFALAHGASATMMFRVRRERDPARIAAILDLSSSTLWAMGIGFLVLLVAGIVGASIEGLWDEGWIWASLVLLVAIMGAMTPLAATYYNRIREAVGAPTWDQARKGVAPGPPTQPEELESLLRSRRPEAIALLGGGGLLAILWLMVFKPF